MSSKKFCMECGVELVIAADGSVGICPKCGKSYNFIDTSAIKDLSVTTPSAYDECKRRATELLEHGNENKAVEEIEKYLKEYPKDYRAYTLYCYIRSNKYTADPVDVVVEQTWLYIRDMLLDGIKVASKEQYALMKAECEEFCKRAERVVQIYYDMKEFEKGLSEEPTAPIDPEIELTSIKSSCLAKLEEAENLLEELNLQYEKVTKEDKLSAVHATPLPTGFFAKRKEMKAREKLSMEIVREKGITLQAISTEREECKKTISSLRLQLAECERKLEQEKPKYLEELAKYEKDLAKYNTDKSQYAEKAMFFKTDATVLAIKDKLEWVKEQIVECENELAKLEKQDVKLTPASYSSADYYLTMAVNRKVEQDLTTKKLRLTYRINNLKYMFTPLRPKPPIFKD